jgi:hypothetical protein
MREILSIIFSYSFVLYLVFFLLETIFPGFVSNNFSLNYILIPVFIFGVLSVIFPKPETEEKETKPASKLDLIILVVLSVGSFFLIFYKFNIDNLILKLTVSLLSSVLTFMLGVILLYFPDGQDNETGKEPVEGESTYLAWLRIIKRSFLSRIHIPVPIALLFVAITLIFIPKNMVKIIHTPTGSPGLPSEEGNVTPMVTLPKADLKMKIIVYNGGAETGEAARFAGIFKEAGYVNVEALNYPLNTNENVFIQFKESDSAQADLIESILKSDYSVVDRWPLASTSAEIRVILGRKPIPETNEPDFENENFDFFFQ